jgi:hypothetical protein
MATTTGGVTTTGGGADGVLPPPLPQPASNIKLVHKIERKDIPNLPLWKRFQISAEKSCTRQHRFISR